ncbi:putative RNA-dependent RNA polymerase 3 [Panicum miliaceum]|uniref:RNA-dependent RNA polymerase 3 n=1 Tax=Panicum miliaceum TaxID=4540 RepID=A0A3L6QYC1_PANMI|nr:putative RNA-dependent RNA polymerase 3 [Panicum miliaceum]
MAAAQKGPARCAVFCNEASKCGFAWKVAGRALCQLYRLKHSGDTVLCSFSVLEGAFKKNHRP